jgi:fucose permease
VAIVAEVIGFLAVPTFARFAQRAVLLALGAVVAVAVALLVAAPLVPALAAAAVAFGFAGAVFYTILQDALFALHPGQAGTTGAVTGTIGLVGLAYPVLVGAVADAHGLTAGLALYAAVPVVMLVLVLADRQ